MCNATQLLQDLIRCPSVTPREAGVLSCLENVLRPAGFTCHRLIFSDADTPDVENLFATIGSGAPHFVFAGHTDVVPPGRDALWSRAPFSGDEADGYIHGRGAQDMKGGIAAFVAAATALVAEHAPWPGTLSVLITNDEEGPAINGTAKLLAWCGERGIRFDACIVGEPTNRQEMGDTVKIGRRGSMSATLSVSGVQGHAAYPHLADNPVHRLARMVARLVATPLDGGSAAFEPSTLQVTALETGNDAYNVIPARATAKLNIRFNDTWEVEALVAQLHKRIARAEPDVDYRLDIKQPVAEAFLTRAGPLSRMLVEAIAHQTGRQAQLTTSGGTSDARFIKDYCPVVEFGLVGDTMHQIDERTPIADLRALTRIYRTFLQRFFSLEGAP